MVLSALTVAVMLGRHQFVVAERLSTSDRKTLLWAVHLIGRTGAGIALYAVALSAFLQILTAVLDSLAVVTDQINP